MNGLSIEFSTEWINHNMEFNGIILEEGKRYRWSGSRDDWNFKNMKCKIMKVETNCIYIYDYDDNFEYQYTNENLKDINAIFKKIVG
mgnify:CR=1 FL=1